MKYMIPGPRENPTIHIDAGGFAANTSSQDGEIEKRVARLETESRYIRRDLDEIRGDTRAIKDQLPSMDMILTVMEHSNGARFESTHQKIDAGFAAAHQKMDAGFAATDKRMDAGFLAVNLKIDVSVASLSQKMDANFSSIHQKLSTVPTKLQLALMALAGLAMILGSAFAVVAVLLRSTGHADVANVLDAARGES